MSGIGGIFHPNAKGVKAFPYLARNFQRNLVQGLGSIHDCGSLDAQVAFLEVMLGQDMVDLLISTGGDGTLGKVTTAARKVLESHNNGRTIDDLLFHHNLAGTQNVVPSYYGLSKFWQLACAATVHYYHIAKEGGPPLEFHDVPQLKITTDYTRDNIARESVEYGCLYIGALLNKFLREHYDVAGKFEKVGLPHHLADVAIIARGAVQPSYARPVMAPVKGHISVDGKDLPLDHYNFLLVFSNDWNIDLKLTDFNPCMKLHKHPGRLQVVAGNATMPDAIYTFFRQAFGLDWKAKDVYSVIGDSVTIESEERHYNLDGDFHACGSRVTVESGPSFKLVRDYSEDYLRDVFSGNEELFKKFLADFSQR